MKTQNCFICLIKENLSTFKVAESKIYQEFTGYKIKKTEKLLICEDCRQNLQNSVKFLKLCKKSYQNLQEQKQIIESQEYSEIVDEITITVDEENFSNEEFIINDESIVDQRTEHAVLEVIEIERVDSKEDKLNATFQCDKCEAEFSSNQKLKSHERKHEGIKEWTCSYDGCDKTFGKELRLKAHIRTHTNEKPYTCDYENCNMKFAQSNALLCHKRIHSKLKPYICQVCGKSFTQNTTLKTHVAAKHTGNQIECDVPGCEKKFPRNSFLILHKKRDHENIRSYNCNECDKQYKQKSHLDRHIEASHKNISQFCDKSFSKSWSLKLHQFKHTEATNFPYKCTECEMSFQRRDLWIKHMNKVHPGIEIKKEAIEIKVPSSIMIKE
ncbi:zinc finger protein ZFP2-like [Chironomus tepperi]|uniref:zinc finger protein ZFP2-like n=1 Tax=Chironomus tepperi TaxID=113505 RepID=UPI00391F92E3